MWTATRISSGRRDARRGGVDGEDGRRLQGSEAASPRWRTARLRTSRRTSSTGARSRRPSPLDRTLINLNNGNTCPSPRVVHEACKRYMDMANMLPVHYRGHDRAATCRTVRRGLADEFGCDDDEVALTRNASESLQIVQNGLDLKAGRRSHHDRAGLPAHADDVGPAACGATRSR